MHQTLQAARFSVARHFPYYNTALWALTFIEKPGLGTFAVDQYWRCYWDPAVFEDREVEIPDDAGQGFCGTKPATKKISIAAWTVKQTEAVLVHEMNHLLRNHADRGKASGADDVIIVDPISGAITTGWNIAGDAEINGMLQHVTYDDGGTNTQIELPPTVVYPKHLNMPDGKLAEEYYEALRKQAKKNGTITIGEGRQGGCGSCSDGQTQGYEDKPDGNSPGTDPADAEHIRRAVAEEINRQKEAGNIPGDLKRWAARYGSKRVPWRSILASIIRSAIAVTTGASNYRYTKPGRRQQMQPDVVVPSLYTPAPEVAVVVDTSGSMSDELLHHCLDHVYQIVKACGGRELTVISCDTEPHTTKRTRNCANVHLEGGGGTDMGAGIAHAMKQRVKPHVIVVLTDGYTPWPEHKPKVPVIVGLVHDNLQMKGPAWARTVVVTDKRDD